MSALFLKILNFSINASWLILAVLVLRLLLKKAPKWIACVLWGLVAVRLICPFSLKSVLSLLPSSEVVPMNIMTAPKPMINTGISVINNAVNPVVSGTFAPEPVSSANPLQIVTAAAAAIWVTGMAIMVIYTLITYIRLKITVRMSIPAEKNACRSNTIEKNTCIPIPDGIHVRICDEIQTPFILGILKPVIYVPAIVKGRSLELVIAHETAHLKRRDHWWKPLGFALLTVYWFNPLCWIAYILFCRDIESACDEKVIYDKDKEYIVDYSRTLLDLSMPGKTISACPLAFGEAGVKERVKSVLNYKKPAFWLILIAVSCCVAAGVCFLTDPVTAANDHSGQITDEISVTQNLDNQAQIADAAAKVNIPGDQVRFTDDPAMKMELEKIYYYSGNTIDGKNIIDFSITLEPDGTFTWYETPYSSFIGMGKYEIVGGVLTLMNDQELTGNSDVNRFRVEGDKLFFIVEDSSNFPYVKLEDGAEFIEGISPVEGLSELPAEQPDQMQEQPAGDVREQFLQWRLTTNRNDRWTQYQTAMNKIIEQITPPEDPVPPGVYDLKPELEAQAEQALGQYYSDIADIASEQLILQMSQNRTPMSEDEQYTNYGASRIFVDVTFGEGMEDTFVSGLIYDFDARVIVDGYEQFPGYPYQQDADGYFHMTGQITVDEGLVTKIYLARQ